MPRTGILIATVEEADAIIANPKYRWRAIGVSSYESDAYPMTLMVSGVGKAFSAAAAAMLARNCDLIVSIGTSGSIA